MKGEQKMSDSQPKQNNHSSNPTLSELLKASSELAANQENFENNLDTDIDLLNARTRNDNSTRDSQYRSRIALMLTRAFIVIMTIIIIGIPIYNAIFGKETLIDQNRLLETFNSIFGTILGFVLGYYFKDKGEGGKR